MFGTLMFPFAVKGFLFPDLGILAWIFLVPLLVNLYQTPKFSKKFFKSFLASFLFNWGSFYWLVPAMNNFGSIHFLASLGIVAAICLILSFLFSFLVSFSFSLTQKNDRLSFLFIALSIVGFDILRSHYPLGGFPWNIPAYSQGEYLSYFQWIDITGVHGLNALIILSNCIIAEIIFSFIEKKRDIFLNRLVLFFMGFALIVVIGIQRSNQVELSIKEKGYLKIALVQGNIDQSLKWDPFLARDHLETYVRLTDRAYIRGAKLVIWPETAYPYTFDMSEMILGRLIPRGTMPVATITGLVSQLPSENYEEIEIFNSVALMDTRSNVQQIYHKRHLVPFGEYIPYKNIFSFAQRMVDSEGDFSYGHSDVIFDLKDVKIGNLICYEDLFPDLARNSALKGANLLVNYTNDAWFEDSSGPYQHLVFSQFRALENRRYLIRSTNNGLTAVINWRGEIESIYPIEKEGFLLKDIQIIEYESFYSKNGNKIYEIVLILMGLFLIYYLSVLILSKFKKNNS